MNDQIVYLPVVGMEKHGTAIPAAVVDGVRAGDQSWGRTDIFPPRRQIDNLEILALPNRHAFSHRRERNRLSVTGAWHRAAAGDGLMWGGDVPEISVHNSTHPGDEPNASRDAPSQRHSCANRMHFRQMRQTLCEQFGSDRQTGPSQPAG
jgi:hypothetical protein